MARIDLRENEYMEKFVGQEHIDSNDVQFWYQLLSCSFNFMRVQDPRIVDKTLDPYLVRLTLNNSDSHNIGSLVRVTLDRVSRIKSPSGQSTNPYYVFQSFNALYLLRCIFKSYIENLSEDKLIQAFRARVDTPSSNTQANPQPLTAPQQFQQIPTQLPDTNSLAQPAVETKTDQQNDPEIPDTTLQLSQEPQQPAVQSAQSTNQPKESQKKIEFTPGSHMLDQCISTLIAIIVDIPLSDSTYLLHVESINALLVLLSIQMYISTPSNESIIYKSLMQKKCSIHALVLTKTLLYNFIRQQPIPQESGSIIIGLASGLWKVLTLGYGTQGEEETDVMPILAKQSLLLLNILTNHQTSDKNPYREAIIACQDSNFNLLDPQLAIINADNDALATAVTSKSALISNSIKIEFVGLFSTICKNLHDDQVALLLYILLHSNKIFRPYILTTGSSHLDDLVMPLLKILYSSIDRGSHHVYMILIIFVILSEEQSFNEAIHKITIRGVPWYKDRVLSEISLGSLTTLIIIRSFQYNTFRIKDKFLHSNLFATLANLSNYFQNLHPYVCQRMVELLERLAKRYLMITKPTKTNPSDVPAKQVIQSLDILNSDNSLAKALATGNEKQDLHDVSSIELDSTTKIETHDSVGLTQNGANININIPEQGQATIAGGNDVPHSSNSDSSQVNIPMDEHCQDLSLYEEVIRMILEVINNIFVNQLDHNSDLIYTLLYKRNVFSSLLSSHQSFYNIIINVERILTFFYNKVESYQRSLSVEEIYELIKSASKDWNFSQQAGMNLSTGSNNNNNNNSLPRLLFHYVEDTQPEEFFIPYVWTRIYYSSGIIWNPKRIVLFSPQLV